MSAAEEEEEDEAFLRNLEESLQTQAQVLKTEFNHLIICWEGNVARHNSLQEVSSIVQRQFGVGGCQ